MQYVAVLLCFAVASRAATLLMKGTGDVCYYKGHHYAQNATWDDGCDYSCSCLDAGRGYYECNPKCVEWELPSICRLDAPRPGCCCQTPSCPSYITMTFPDGYKPEVCKSTR